MEVFLWIPTFFFWILVSSLSDFNIIFNSFLVHRTCLRLVYKLIAEASSIFFFASSKCYHFRIPIHTKFHIILLFISLSLPITSSSPPLSPLTFSSLSPLHLPYLFISPTNCSPNLLFKPYARILFWPPRGSIVVYVSKVQYFSLFASWLDIFVDLGLYFFYWICGF